MLVKADVPPLALRSREAALSLGISERTLARLRATGDIPFVRVGAAILFPVYDLSAWLARKTERGTLVSIQE